MDWYVMNVDAYADIAHLLKHIGSGLGDSIEPEANHIKVQSGKAIRMLPRRHNRQVAEERIKMPGEFVPARDVGVEAVDLAATERRL